MRNMFIFIGVFLVIAFLIIIGFQSKSTITGEVISDLSNIKIQEKQQPLLQDEDKFSNSTELHFGHMPILYNITKSECGDFQTKRIRWVFDVLTNETQGVITFIETQDNADISVICYPYTPERGVGNEYTAGRGGYFSNGNEIKSATLEFFNVNPLSNTYPGGCLIYPDVEVHELLHALGFPHICSTKSITSL